MVCAQPVFLAGYLYRTETRLENSRLARTYNFYLEATRHVTQNRFEFALLAQMTGRRQPAWPPEMITMNVPRDNAIRKGKTT